MLSTERHNKEDLVLHVSGGGVSARAGGLKGTVPEPPGRDVLCFCIRYLLCTSSGSFQGCSSAGAQAAVEAGSHAERQTGQIQGC